MKTRILSALLLALAGQSVLAVEDAPSALQEITNFRQYSEVFASSGQPTEAQLQAVADEGFERVVYIAFTNNQNALLTKTRS